MLEQLARQLVDESFRCALHPRPEFNRRIIMARCILHIGTFKTGTSAIQAFLRRNRDELGRRGVFVSEILQPGFGRLSRFALDEKSISAARREAGEVTTEGVSAWRSVVEAELNNLAQTAEQSDGCAVLSDESLCELTRIADVDRLHRALSACFSSTRVILYLRPQNERETSGYTQALRHGDVPPSILPATGHSADIRLDYAAMIARWVGVFGEDALSIRLYHPKQLVDGDAIHDFARLIGLDPEGLDHVGRQNPGLSPEGQRLLRWFNRRMPRFREDGDHDPTRKRIAQAINSAFVGKGAAPSRQAAELLLRRYEAGNEAIRRRWFPDRASLFDIDLSDLPAEEPRLDAEEGELIELLWRLSLALAERNAELDEVRSTLRRRIVALRQRNEKLKSRS